MYLHCNPQSTPFKPQMDSQLAANYEEFEPFCNWQREEARDTLVLHLPAFKKEQLKVQISNLKVLKISGERPLSGLKRCRFYKEVKVANECNADEIRAKFVNGLLYVVMPKKTSAVPEKEEAPSSNEQVQANNKQPNESGTSPDEEKKTLPSEQENYVPTPSWSNIGTKLALVITLGSAIGVYIYYRYTNIQVGELDDAKVFNLCQT